MWISKTSKAQARYSRGLWAPRSIGLNTQIRLWQTLVRSILLCAAEAHAWQPRGVETLDKWRNHAPRHTARALVHVSRERTQDRRRGSVRTVTFTFQVRGCSRSRSGFVREHTQRTNVQVLAKPWDYGVRANVVGKGPFALRSSVSGDLDARRAAAWDAGEDDDPTLRCARVAARSLGIDLQHDNTSRELQWWKWLLAVPVTSIHMLLSYTTKADLYESEQQPRETPTCKKCGAKVRGERGLKVHLQQ